MQPHILLNLARHYVPSSEVTPCNSVYCKKNGYWLNVSTNLAVILSPNFNRQASKKSDIETGEDQKGE